MNLGRNLKLTAGTVLFVGAMLFLSDLLLLIFNALRNNGFVVMVFDFNYADQLWAFNIQILGQETVQIAQLEAVGIILVMFFVAYLYGAWYSHTVGGSQT